LLRCSEAARESLDQQGRTMTFDTNSSSLASLLSLVKTLKRDDVGLPLSTSEKEARISNVIEKLAGFQPLSLSTQAAPITLSAEER
jgi:hypothetical protein